MFVCVTMSVTRLLYQLYLFTLALIQMPIRERESDVAMST